MSGRGKTPPTSVEAFLCDHYWLKRENFPQCPDVFAALRIAGDDCFDFMQEFGECFGVDLKLYDWSKYHHSEGEEMDLFGLFRAISRLFGRPWSEPPRDRPIHPISATHLMAVLEAKRWFDPDPMPPPRGRKGGSLGRLLSR